MRRDPHPDPLLGREREQEVVVLDDADAVARAAAERFVAIAREALAARGGFTVALSGGSTPRALFHRLAAEPDGLAVPWARTDVFWGDERCVSPAHAESNYGMAKAALLDAVPIPPARVHRIAGEAPDPDAAAAAYEAEIARVFGAEPGGPPPAFDLVLLGLGADGHTASLFPGTRALGERRHWVVANQIPTLGATRITLTWPILNRAVRVLFLVAGADKATALHGVLDGPFEPERLPAQGVRPAAGAPVWLVDRAAASGLAHLGGRRETAPQERGEARLSGRLSLLPKHPPE